MLVLIWPKQPRAPHCAQFAHGATGNANRAGLTPCKGQIPASCGCRPAAVRQALAAAAKPPPYKRGHTLADKGASHSGALSSFQHVPSGGSSKRNQVGQHAPAAPPAASLKGGRAYPKPPHSPASSARKALTLSSTEAGAAAAGAPPPGCCCCRLRGTRPKPAAEGGALASGRAGACSRRTRTDAGTRAVTAQQGLRRDKPEHANPQRSGDIQLPPGTPTPALLAHLACPHVPLAAAPPCSCR